MTDHNKIQYRTEDAYGEGYRNASEVMCHEIFELGNADIMDYFSTHYLGNNEALRLKTNDYINSLIEVGYVDDLDEQQKLDFCNELLKELNEQMHTEIKYCLWLADKSTVINPQITLN